jgi:tetratricopeptide (TPR) repeat protein
LKNNVKASGTIEPDTLQEAEEQLVADPGGAVGSLRKLLEAEPLNVEAYQLLGRALDALRSEENGEGGLAASIVSGATPRLMRAAHALQLDDLPTAEAIVRARLLEEPRDFEALRMFADIASRLGLVADAESLLRYALSLRPDSNVAKLELAKQLQLGNHMPEALEVVDEVISAEPGNERALYLKAVVLGHMGRFSETASIYEDLIRRGGNRARLWASYGRSLKTLGRGKEGVDAFRKAIALDSSLGEAWWSLSDLKTVKLDEDDIAVMLDVLKREDLSEKDRYYIHFALGKAHEDKRNYAASFNHYAEGNRLRRTGLEHDAARHGEYVSTSKRLFTREFFAAREGSGSKAPDPIFILGMSRAGSTLIEQILASHPQVEGTMELPNVSAIARDLTREFQDRPAAVAALDPGEFSPLGERYIAETRAFRKTDRPYFVDKMPNNWLSIPLIHLMLPNARIIDARRHPLACCFSNFKQNYAVGQTFSYDLEDLGAYYSDYVRMMAHMDEVLPGKVHRVFHERMVEDTEGEIRRLLDYLGLPFDEACLRFHENQRAVRTASAEQVRRPINRHGVDLWQSYEAWLGPLKKALGPVLEQYPEVPPFRE